MAAGSCGAYSDAADEAVGPTAVWHSQMTRCIRLLHLRRPTLVRSRLVLLLVRVQVPGAAAAAPARWATDGVGLVVRRRGRRGGQVRLRAVLMLLLGVTEARPRLLLPLRRYLLAAVTLTRWWRRLTNIAARHLALLLVLLGARSGRI